MLEILNLSGNWIRELHPGKYRMSDKHVPSYLKMYIINAEPEFQMCFEISGDLKNCDVGCAG